MLRHFINSQMSCIFRLYQIQYQTLCNTEYQQGCDSVIGLISVLLHDSQCHSLTRAFFYFSFSAAQKAGFKMPGYRPSEMDKKILVWSGRFKTKEQIPEFVS